MQKIILFSFLLLGLASCSKNEREQALPPSLQAIIQNNISCICEPYIKKYTWRNQVVYMQGNSGPTCNWTPLYYDEKGLPITMPTGYTLNDFLAEASFIKTVWVCGVK